MAKEDIEEFADQLTEETLQAKNSNPLLPATIEKEKIRLDIRNHLEASRKKTIRGTKLLLQRLKQLSAVNSEIALDQAVQELGRIQPFKSKGKEKTFSLKEIFKISDETMRACLLVAIDYYNHQEYLEASEVFFVLGFIDPSNAFIWKGLGNSYFQAMEHEEAVKAYEICSEIDPADPDGHFFIAYSLNALGRHGDALESLHRVIDICNKTKRRDLKEQALQKMNQIKMTL